MILSSKKSLDEQGAVAGAFFLFGVLFSTLLMTVPAHVMADSMRLYCSIGFITFFSLFFGLLYSVQLIVAKILVATGVLPEWFPVKSTDTSAE